MADVVTSESLPIIDDGTATLSDASDAADATTPNTISIRGRLKRTRMEFERNVMKHLQDSAGEARERVQLFIGAMKEISSNSMQQQRELLTALTQMAPQPIPNSWQPANYMPHTRPQQQLQPVSTATSVVSTNPPM